MSVSIIGPGTIGASIIEARTARTAATKLTMAVRITATQSMGTISVGRTGMALVPMVLIDTGRVVTTKTVSTIRPEIITDITGTMPMRIRAVIMAPGTTTPASIIEVVTMRAPSNRAERTDIIATRDITSHIVGAITGEVIGATDITAGITPRERGITEAITGTARIVAMADMITMDTSIMGTTTMSIATTRKIITPNTMQSATRVTRGNKRGRLSAFSNCDFMYREAVAIARTRRRVTS